MNKEAFIKLAYIVSAAKHVHRTKMIKRAFEARYVAAPLIGAGIGGTLGYVLNPNKKSKLWSTLAGAGLGGAAGYGANKLYDWRMSQKATPVNNSLGDKTPMDDINARIAQNKQQEATSNTTNTSTPNTPSSTTSQENAKIPETAKQTSKQESNTNTIESVSENNPPKDIPKRSKRVPSYFKFLRDNPTLVQAMDPFFGYDDLTKDIVWKNHASGLGESLDSGDGINGNPAPIVFALEVAKQYPESETAKYLKEHPIPDYIERLLPEKGILPSYYSDASWSSDVVAAYDQALNANRDEIRVINGGLSKVIKLDFPRTTHSFAKDPVIRAKPDTI